MKFIGTNKSYLEEGDVGEAEDKLRDDEELEADEERVEEQGKFERAYNFRFEEPDQEYLKRYPRTMDYVRPKDDRRSRKRAEVRERKEEEKRRKMEEIARLKALKLKEIQEKIARIKEVTGNEELAFKEDDLNSDFDPDEHDKRMKEIFDEQYYGEADTEKPVFPDLDEELEIENWENYEPECGDEADQGRDGPHCEDEDFNMDADYDPKKARENLIEELKRSQGKKRRNRKKKSKLAELLSSEKPKFVPTVAEKTYNDYMEEYYKMDCEDVIGGDLPTRFKYREVIPNDYGLTVEEILLADDKELTQWVPLKKILKHRPESLEKGDAKTYAQKAADLRLKKKVLPSLFKDLPEEPEIVVPIEEVTKKKKKKKKNKNKDIIQTPENKNNETVAQNTETSEEVNTNIGADISQDNKIKKKKKKHKLNAFVVENVQHAEPSHDGVLEDTEIQPQFTEVDGQLNKEDKHHLEGINNNNTEKASKKKKNKLNKQHLQVNDVRMETNNNLKHKSNTDIEQPNIKKRKGNKDNSNNKKINFKQTEPFKSKNKNYHADSSDPLNTLSDERLKAYGLNPKKYRNFRKYKKF